MMKTQFLPSFKKSRLLVSLAALSTFGAGFCEAQVIIDGTAPDYVNNGSFEKVDDWWSGAATDLSNDLGLDVGLLLRNGSGTAQPTDGTYYSIIAKDSNSGNRGFYLDTGYALSEGDTFDLSFTQGNHNNSLEEGDTFAWQLFTVDPETGTVADIVASDTVLASVTPPPDETNTMKAENYSSIGTVTGAMAGKNLYIAFLPSGDLSGDYIALDQVNLSVSNAIPEPASAVLISGFLALGIVGLRRRRR